MLVEIENGIKSHGSMTVSGKKVLLVNAIFDEGLMIFTRKLGTNWVISDSST